LHQIGNADISGAAVLNCLDEPLRIVVVECVRKGNGLIVYSHWTFLQKLMSGVGLMVLCLLGLSFSSWRSISLLGTALDDAATKTSNRLILLGETRTSFLELKSESQGQQVAYAIQAMDRKRSDKASEVTCLGCHTPNSSEETAHRIEARGQEVQKQAADLRKLVGDDQKSLSALDELGRGAGLWVDNTKEYLKLANGGHFEDAHAVLTEKTFPILPKIEEASKTLNDREQETIASFRQEAASEIRNSQITAGIFILLSVACCAVMFFVVLSMSRKLQKISNEIATGSDELASASEQIAGSSQSLAQGASEQAASLEETSSSASEVSAMTTKNAGHSCSAAELMAATAAHIVTGNKKVDEMMESMAEIRASSEKIGKIIKTIDEIAFQTNILALNAAVEAARAGESGMGFAVVADEVRNLAQRCAQAAKDTAGLIEDSITKSHDGSGKLTEVAEAIRCITLEADKVRGLIGEVSSGSQEQSKSLQQVNQAIEQMEAVTQKTASAAEECASAAEELSAESKTLRDIAFGLSEFVGAS